MSNFSQYGWSCLILRATVSLVEPVYETSVSAQLTNCCCFPCIVAPRWPLHSKERLCTCTPSTSVWKPESLADITAYILLQLIEFLIIAFTRTLLNTNSYMITAVKTKEMAQVICRANI